MASVQQLVAMGFLQADAARVLQSVNGNMDLAVDRLLRGAVDAPAPPPPPPRAPAPRPVRGARNTFAPLVNEAARSGDGTVANVGIKMTGTFLCEECCQRYDSDKALGLHVRFTHGGRILRVISLLQDGDATLGIALSGEELFRLDYLGATAQVLRNQIADALGSVWIKVKLTADGRELADDDAIEDLSTITVQFETDEHVGMEE